LQRAFFSLEDTRTPFLFTSVQVALHIIGSISLGLLLPPEWLVVGIAGLTGFTILIQGLLAHTLLKRRIGKPTNSGVGLALAKFMAAGVVSAVVGYLCLTALGGVGAGAFPVDRVFTAVVSAILVGTAMLLTYLALLWLVRMPELRELAAILRRALSRG
jgi:putative peptidoglycan lipid II flippase